MTDRQVWIKPGEVDARPAVGRVCRTVTTITHNALRRHDGLPPVEAGALVRIVETRPYGASLAVVLAADASEAGEVAGAMLDLQADGLFEVMADPQ